MSIRLIQYERNDRGEIDERAGRVRRFPADRLIVGAHSNCDLSLAGIPDIAFAICKEDGGDYVIERKDKQLPVFVNDVALANDCMPVRNGDRIRFAPYELHFMIEFERARLHRSAGVVAHAATFLIAVILILEIGVITWLPRQVQSRELWGLEITRQRTVDSLDTLRLRCNAALPQKSTPLQLETLRFVKGELDGIAGYLRAHGDDLDVGRILDVQADLEMYEEILDRLDQGTLYPPRETLDLEFHLRRMLETNGGK